MSNEWNDLAEDESVAYRARLHWVVLILPLPILVYLLFGAPGIMFLISGLCGLKDPNFDAPSFILAGIFDMCLTTIVVIAVVMRMKSAKFLVTNKRVILKSGIIKRRAAEVPLEEILSINVYQDIFDRLFSQGIITITTVTRETTVQFSHVSNPVEFRRQVQEQVARIGANGSVLANWR